MKKNSKQKAPSFQFYPADWLTDPALTLCNHTEKGLWIDLLCHMHMSSQYGFLNINGKVLDEKMIQKLSKSNPKVFQKAFSNLKLFGVISYDEKLGFYSKRMVSDEAFRQKRREWGALGKEHGEKGKDFGIEGKEFGKLGGRPKKKTPPLTPRITPPPSSSSSSSLIPVCVGIPRENEKISEKEKKTQPHTPDYFGEISEVVNFWNSKVPEGYHGKNATVKNGVALLPRCGKIDSDLQRIFRAMRGSEGIEFETFKSAIQNYAEEICSRVSVEGKDYDSHRFSFYEFITKRNGFKKFM